MTWVFALIVIVIAVGCVVLLAWRSVRRSWADVPLSEPAVGLGVDGISETEIAVVAPADPEPEPVLAQKPRRKPSQRKGKKRP